MNSLSSLSGVGDLLRLHLSKTSMAIAVLE